MAPKRERKWSVILFISRKKNKRTKVDIQCMYVWGARIEKKHTVGKNNNKRIMQWHLKFCFSSNTQPCHALLWLKHKYFRFTNKCRPYIVLNRIITTNIIQSYWAITQNHYQPKHCLCVSGILFSLSTELFSRAEKYYLLLAPKLETNGKWKSFFTVQFTKL